MLALPYCGSRNYMAHSGCSNTERYFREGMLALPYCGSRNYMARAVAVLQGGTVGRICKSAPTVFMNYMAQAVKFVR